MKFVFFASVCLWVLVSVVSGSLFSGPHRGGRAMVNIFQRQATNDTFPAPPACVDSTFETQFSLQYSFKSVVDCAVGTVTFTISAPTNGWVGIGFGQDRMTLSDIYVGTVLGGVLDVTDRFAPSNYNYFDVPLEDTAQGGQNNIVGTPTFTQNGGLTSITFTRPLDTQDPTDFQFTGGNVPLIYAYGASPALVYHSNTRNFGIAVDIFAGGAVNNGVGADFRAAHGVLMIFAWMLVLVLTIYLARYMKDIGPMWFRIHQVLNLIAVLISLVAWIEIVASLKYYLARSHHILGTIVVFFSIVQPILGFLADKMYDPNRTKAPVFPDIIHNWLGRLTMVCAVVTIYLGFCAYGVHPAVWGIFSAWLLLIIVFQIVSEVVIGAVNHNGDSAKDEGKLKKAKMIFGILLATGVIFWVILAALITVLREQVVVCNY